LQATLAHRVGALKKKEALHKHGYIDEYKEIMISTL